MKNRWRRELLRRLMGMTLRRGCKCRDAIGSAVSRHRREPSVGSRERRRHEVVIRQIAGIVVAHPAPARRIFETVKLRESLGSVYEAVHQRRAGRIPPVVIAMTLKPCRAEVLDAESVQLERR